MSSGCPGLSASTVETEYQKVNFLCHLRPTSLIICSDGSGGSRISRGGGQPQREVPAYYLTKNAENCMKMKKIRPRWWRKGTRPKFYFVDPSLDGSMDSGFPRGGGGAFYLFILSIFPKVHEIGKTRTENLSLDPPML